MGLEEVSAAAPGPRPSSRPATRVAWATVAIVVLAVIVAVVLAPPSGMSGLRLFAELIGHPVYAIVGAVIVARRPGNAIGWVMLVGAAAFAVEEAATSYVEASVAGRLLPGPVWAAWLTTWVWSPAWIALFGWLPLIFPDGRVLNRRWRWLSWVLAASSLQVFAAMLLPDLTYGRGEEQIYGQNPIGLKGQGQLLDAVVEGVAAIFVLVWVATIVMQVLRYRRAGAVQRLQMRWFLWSIVLVLGLIMATIIPGVETVIQRIPTGIAFSLIPVAVGVAVTRYRLYELDRIISRTVTFATVAGLLVGIYAFSVLAVGAVLSRAGPSTDLVVATSTLLAAAAFRPLLVRVRAVVERRFDRQRYDAAAAVSGFAARLRDELDLERIDADLVGLIRGTLQPSAVGLWIPDPDAHRSSSGSDGSSLVASA